MKRRTALLIWAIAATVIAAWSLIFPIHVFFVHALINSALNVDAHPPKIVARSISDDDWRDETVANRKLTALWEQKFPAGTDESFLKSELLKAGFKPLSSDGKIQCHSLTTTQRIGFVSATCIYPANVFEYSWAIGIVCSHSVFVSWSTNDQGKVGRIEGKYHSACL